MSLSPSPAFELSAKPTRSASLTGDSYVLSIAALPDVYGVLASAPSNKIHLFDRGSLRPTTTLEGHSAGATQLRAADSALGASRRVLVSSGKDCTVKVWDGRSDSPVMQMKQAGPARALLSVDVSPDGNTIAAGTELKSDEAQIVYWDPRKPAAPLRAHSSTHSDDITTLHYLRGTSGPSILLSASSDGLLSISNADEEDEDEAVIRVGNWGCSIAQAGWMSTSSAPPRVWAASDMETFSIWSDEFELANDLDIRNPTVHTQDVSWVTDYLIGCHASDASGFSVFVGSNEGDVAFLRNEDYSDRASPWTLERLFVGAHTGVVRSLFWDETNNVLLTGGEDSRLHAWTCTRPSSGSSSMDAGLSSGGFSPRKRDLDGDVEMGDTDDRVGAFRL
ncbi:WD40 repeat-like protein [Vararia minispora EC-137]|uniref:WD40 repeat-like protein n=1 Tax=Vararia minispora EC-137 TaxID=1314806 RepID=A0ACB8QJ07_9AGAM|nr:WD40 repeat-like protein [Vararia minispora EC-137]